MRYAWNGQCAFEMASIPKAAAERLKLAGALPLRVLVWLACAGQGEFDAAACAAACGGSPESCSEALQYWVSEGLLTVDTPQAVTAAWVTSPDEAVFTAPKASVTVSRSPTVTPPLTVTPPPTVILPEKTTAAARPTRAEVLEVQGRDERFAFLLRTASEKLGKVLSPADMAVYLHLYGTVGLPPEVILMIIGYAVKNGKAKLSYIEKIALNWAEQGIVTMDAADAHLCRLERLETAWSQISEWAQLQVLRPTLAQKEAACRWIYEWKFEREVLVLVLAHTAEKTGKFQATYADRILERFRELGIRTVDAAQKELESPKPAAKKKRTAPMKTAENRTPSFDLGDYESMALRHRPRPPKQEG